LSRLSVSCTAHELILLRCRLHHGRPLQPPPLQEAPPPPQQPPPRRHQHHGEHDHRRVRRGSGGGGGRRPRGVGVPEQGVPAGAVGAGPKPATDSAGEREPAVSDARQHGKKRVPYSGAQRQHLQGCLSLL